jgi:hypothetical protein
MHLLLAPEKKLGINQDKQISFPSPNHKHEFIIRGKTTLKEGVLAVIAHGELFINDLKILIKYNSLDKNH